MIVEYLFLDVSYCCIRQGIHFFNFTVFLKRLSHLGQVAQVLILRTNN